MYVKYICICLSYLLCASILFNPSFHGSQIFFKVSLTRDFISNNERKLHILIKPPGCVDVLWLDFRRQIYWTELPCWSCCRDHCRRHAAYLRYVGWYYIWRFRATIICHTLKNGIVPAFDLLLFLTIYTFCIHDFFRQFVPWIYYSLRKEEFMYVGSALAFIQFLFVTFNWYWYGESGIAYEWLHCLCLYIYLCFHHICFYFFCIVMVVVEIHKVFLGNVFFKAMAVIFVAFFKNVIE